MDSEPNIQYTILSEYQCTVCIVGIGVWVRAGFGIADIEWGYDSFQCSLFLSAAECVGWDSNSVGL